MATYLDLFGLYATTDLIKKVSVACSVAANSYLTGTPTADQKAWAYSVLTNPEREAEIALKALLAENKDQSVATITSATDAAIQTKVDDIKQYLVDARAGV